MFERFITALAFCVFFGVPIALVWGWTRWVRYKGSVNWLDINAL
jgi:hypothetical protein